MVMLASSVRPVSLVLLLVSAAVATRTQKRAVHKPFPAHPLEQPLHALEKAQLDRLKRILTERDIHVGGFYHTGPALKYWNHVIAEQLLLLDGYYTVPKENATYYEAANGAFHRLRAEGSGGGAGGPTGLMAIADDLFIGLQGDDDSRRTVHRFILSLNLSYIDRVRFEHRNAVKRSEYSNLRNNPEKQAELRARADRMQPVATEGEYHTVQAVHDYCKRAVRENRSTIVFYFHTKTMGEGRQLIPASCWRDIMNAYTVEFPSICIRALLKGYSSCGPLLSSNAYNGNFWWASCTHVANLPGLWDPINNAYKAEEFIHNVSLDWAASRRWFKNMCAYGSYWSPADLYHERVLRGSYMEDIYSKLTTDSLPPSLGRERFQKDNDIVFKGEPCYSLLSNMSSTFPYFEHSYWPRGGTGGRNTYSDALSKRM